MAQKSLIEELPRILKEGKEEAAKLLERLSDPVKISLQTNELVLPAKDVDGLFKGQVPKVSPDYHSDVFGLFGEGLFAGKPMKNAPWINRLIYGDNLLVMQALLAGDEKPSLESLRGRVDLVYIDPPFDSKADYRTKIHLPGTDISQKPTEVMDKDPLALIEYWSVDPNYNGQMFRSVWQDYRENTENDDDPEHCVRTAEIVVPKLPDGQRVVCVKAVDVFGFESEAKARV